MKVTQQLKAVKYFPLTLSQQDIFYHQLKIPNSPLYNVGGYIRLAKVDVNKLQQAHQQLVKEQDVFGLRVLQPQLHNCTFTADQADDVAKQAALQYISDERDTQLAIVDFSDADNSYQQAEQKGQSWLKQLFETAIDIENQPLFRSYLIKLSVERFYYVGFAHHLALDGWGFANWAKRLGQIYQGSDVESPNLSWQQLTWQEIAQQDQEYVESAKYQRDRSYWQQQQLKPTPLIPAFYRHQFHDAKLTPSSREILAITPEQVTAVSELAEQLKVSVASVYLAAIACYLSQTYLQSKQNAKLVFGLPAHNRKNHQQKNMLAVFTSISPLQIDCDHTMSFAQFVVQVAQQQRLNYRHQRYPIGHMMADIGEQQQAIYDVAFNYLKLDSQLCFDGQSADLVYLSHHHEQTPLSLTLWEYGEQRDSQLQIDFNLAYFTQAEVAKLKLRLQHVLPQLLQQPNLTIEQLSCLPQAEVQSLLALGRADDKGSQQLTTCGQNVISMFAEQVENNPATIALVAGEQQLSYLQLDCAANVIAKRLQSAGVTSQQPVGVCFSRRVELIVAILAVLKAGAAYVPLDPSYPQARLSHMVADSGMTQVLSETGLSEVLPLFANSNIHLVDQVLACEEHLSTQDNGFEQPLIQADDLAYVIYTSGSTGQPKGVCCHHGGLVNLLNDFQQRRPLAVGDRGSLWTSTSFDVSVYEIFSCLCYGASLHLVPEPVRIDCDGLFAWLAQQQITSAFLPGFSLNPLADWLAQSGHDLALQRLLVGVEPIFPTTLCRIEQNLADVTIINGYGPSEATICSTLYQLAKHQLTEQQPPSYHHYVPIGRAVNNARLYVLDQNLSLLPQGMVGELYIGGAGVANGYLNQQDLTAQRFIDDKFSTSQADSKLYRTGDLVRWLPDGQLAFIGRNDDQVKIRGYRIELEEIETQLVEFAGIADAIVLVNQQQLIAYFTCSDEGYFVAGKGLTQLRHHMAKKLPSYMVPSAFVPLQAFPLSPNGKIDKRALPSPQACHLVDEFVAPSNEIERVIASLCAQLLSIDVSKISMQANFASLGGDSLKVVKLLSGLNQQFNCDLTLQDVFASESFAALAKQIAAAQIQDKQATSTSAIQTVGLAKRNQAVLSKNQQRLWFIDQFESGSWQYNIAGGFRVEGPFSLPIAEQAFKLIIERHEILRTVYQKSVDSPSLVSQHILTEWGFELASFDLTDIAEQQQTQRLNQIRSDYQTVEFDLASDVLVKVAFVQLKHHVGVLLLTVHHIAFDGWSAGILLDEFSQCYHSLVANHQPANLPALPLQYGDFAIWQQSDEQHQALAQPLSYWQNQLADAPSLHNLPLDFPRPKVKGFSGGQQHAELNLSLSHDLDQLATQWAVTPFVLFHSVLALLIARHSRESDIVIGTVSANRERAELQSLIGFFVNTLVLRTDLSDCESFSDIVKLATEVNQQALAHQQMPFEYLVEQLNVARDTSATPLFQILLTMAVDEALSTSIPEVNFTPLTEFAAAAKFDLNLNISRVDEGYQLQWIYDVNLFSAKTITRFNARFCQLLTNVLARPQAKLSELSMLTDAEVTQQLQPMFQAPLVFDRQLKLHRLFESQAAKVPQQLAVCYQDKQLSYAELNAQANQLARMLQQQGITLGSKVAVCYPRSVEMTVVILAVLKLGAVIVPIDPNYPPKRMQHMLLDSGIECLFVKSQGFALPQDLADVQRLDLFDPECQSQLLNFADDNLPAMAFDQRDNALAYVIYTSGSTGLPKGVACYHHSLINLLMDFERRQPLAVGSRCALWTNISFDVAMYEMFSALCYGNSLYVILETVRTAPAELFAFLVEHGINSCYLPGFALNPLAAFVQQDDAKLALTRVLVGVEPINHQLLYQIQQAVDGLKIINGYGPSETTVCSTLYDVDRPQSNGSVFVPIGRAVANTQLLVLDPLGQLCPIGTVGELYIGGFGLSYGYLNNPAQTALRFIDNPFYKGEQKGERSEKLYRTGDLVRWDEQGCLHFVGRVDFQVKLRGQRIELGEIEQQLTDIEGIDSAIASVQQNQQGEDYLLAHVVSVDGADANLSLDSVRQQLSEYLPLHMIPASIVFLPQWPRTTNGKIDKQALPLPQLDDSGVEAAISATEKRLCVIWAQLLTLDVTKVGRNSQFFQLGGHSLLALKALAEIKRSFAVELSIKQLFMQADVASIARLIDSLQLSDSQQKTDNRIALLPQSIDKKSADSTSTIAVSSAQQRLWFIDQMAEDSREYNMSMAYEVDGQFDLALAQQALTYIIERHQPLRTTFARQDTGKDAGQDDDNSTIVAKLRAASDFVINVHKLDEHRIDEQDFPSQSFDGLLTEPLLEMVTELSNKPFDLSRDLMLRCDFITPSASSDKGILLFCLHHIACDGWSIGLMVEEFAMLYEQLKAKQTPDLPPLAMSYSDYAHWQRQYAQSDEYLAQVDYWQQHLAQLPLVHDLSLRQARGEHKSHQAAVYRAPIAQKLQENLQRLAAERGMTLFMLLHGAFALMLSRHSNNQDIVVGTPVANRNYSQLQSLIGLLVNSLVLRVDTDQTSLDDYLNHIKQVNIAAQANQDVPFEHLIEQCQVPRNSRYAPMFQLMISMDVEASLDLSLTDCQLSPLPERDPAVLFDIDLVIKTVNNQLQLCWYYDEQLFTGERISEFSRHMLQLLTQFIEHCEHSVELNDVVMLSEQDRANLLGESEAQTVENSAQSTLLPHQMFEHHAQTHPDAIALELAEQNLAEQKLSYQKLNQQANQLARYLMAEGVMAGDFVGVCLPRCSELIVAVVAVLKVGGVFVPLDPQYPASRLSYMLSDTGMKRVLCLDTAPEAVKAQAIVLDHSDTCEKLQKLDSSNLAVTPQQADDLAYVIYTSGSTGKPKGVMVSLGNWLSYHEAATSLYQTTKTDRVMQFCSISFDVFIEELSLSLLTGATLVMPQHETVLDAGMFWRWVTEQRITIVTLPTAFWHHLSSKEQLAEVSEQIQLRLVATGGEAMQLSYLQDWLDWQRDFSQKVTLLNMYGPTEATIVVTECDMANIDLTAGFDSALPIGKAMCHAKLLIVNSEQQLVPYGAVGELYIGGPSVARGYLNRADLTAKAFVANPVTGDTSQVWYRTGDLVRYDDEGNLLFLGRIDNQVKWLGYRIELGEIEAAIAKHPQVKSCVAFIQQNQSTPQLLAYVLPQPPLSNVDVIDVADILKAQLPSHMLPNSIISIEAWPLSPNGKIDKQALPEPQQVALETYIAPTNEVEQQLQQLWAQLLGLEAASISLYSNFFSLGGHSLLATRLVNRIEQHFAIQFRVKTVFSDATLQQMAANITTQISEQAASTDNVIAVTTETPHKLSAQQQRLWLLQQLSGQNAYNMYQAFELQGALDIPVLQQALDTIVTRHQVLATAYRLDNNQVVPQLQTNNGVRVNLIDLSLNSDSDSDSDLEADPLASLEQHLQQQQLMVFDLTVAPLMAITVYRTAPDSHVLMICVHHIVADGWSVGLFIDELSLIYSALKTGVDAGELLPQLPQLSIQYHDYSAWQAQLLAQNSLGQDYWLEQLQDLPQCHNLPLDKPRPRQQSYNGALYQHSLSPSLSQQLVEFANARSVTLFMLLQTAFAVLLSRYSQTEDVVMGTPVANREQAQLEHLLGCFVNTLVLRSHITTGVGFEQLLASNQQMLLDAFAHQSYPFELLVEQLNHQRSTAFSPLFQVLFVMHNNEQASLQLEGLTVSDRPLAHHMAKFDLTLNVETLTEVETGNNQLALAWEYNTDLFVGTSIAQMGACFEQLLTGLLASPQTDVALLPLIAEREINKAVVSQRQTEIPASLSVHQLVENQAAQQAQTTAIVSVQSDSASVAITYAELNAKANQMAHYFVQQGIAAGIKVGVMLGHDIDTVACLLALMKAGICYVPLDVNTGDMRLQQIMADGEIEVLISHSNDNSKEFELQQLLALDEIDFSQYANTNPQLSYDPQQLVYVLFTSGSTGKPKGVEIRHHSLVNFLLSMAKQPGFSATDTLLAVTPLTFDIVGLELYLPLISGGTLLLDHSAATQDGKRLNQLMANYDITVMQATPTMWRMLLDSGWQGNSQLKLLTGGEAITPELATKLSTHCQQLWNMYGPTETTIWSSCGQLQLNADSHEVEVHIGEAIDNTSLYILDQGLNPVPNGVPGQLYIGGSGLAKGYLNRPELTASQFIQHPHIEDQRLYATGDWARVQADGKLQHLGRVDHQIKLRGFRIEPGEIESALNAHPQINDSLVMVVNHNQRTDLVAYYVAVNDAVSNAEIRQYLSARLPDYMIPTIFMAIDHFQLTSSGKKDRKALPQPSVSRAQLNNEYVAPSSELQQFIVSALKQLVQVEQLGIDDNFFDVGATSLDMVKLAAQLSEHIGSEISPVDLFNHANVRQLATFVQASVSSAGTQKITRSEKQTEQLTKAKSRLKNRRKRKA